MLNIMTIRDSRPHELAWRVFRGGDAIRAGLVTPDKLRSLAWTRLRYGIYADSRLEEDHLLRCHAAALALPAAAVIAGRSAAVIHDVRPAAGWSDDVDAAVSPQQPMGPRAGLRIHRVAIDPVDIVDNGWCRFTAPARTAYDLATWQDLPTAVGIIDVMIRQAIIEPADLVAIAARLSGRRGTRRAERAFALADGRAQSLPESHLRVRLVLGGLPAPVPQCPVRLPSGLVLHPDLGWPEYQVGMEYDGLWHANASQLSIDRRRLNQLVAAGWIMLHVTADRMRGDFLGLLHEARQALISRGWRR